MKQGRLFYTVVDLFTASIGASLPYLDVKFLIFSYACCLKSGMERTACKYVYLLTRGGWTCYKRYLNILLLIAFFSLVFHVTLNSRNTKLKNDWVHWGSLDIQIVLHVGFKAMYFVFSKHWVKLTNCDL